MYARLSLCAGLLQRKVRYTDSDSTGSGSHNRKARELGVSPEFIHPPPRQEDSIVGAGPAAIGAGVTLTQLGYTPYLYDLIPWEARPAISPKKDGSRRFAL
jgi:hypothetical protein